MADVPICAQVACECFGIETVGADHAPIALRAVECISGADQAELCEQRCLYAGLGGRGHAILERDQRAGAPVVFVQAGEATEGCGHPYRLAIPTAWSSSALLSPRIRPHTTAAPTAWCCATP